MRVAGTKCCAENPLADTQWKDAAGNVITFDEDAGTGKIHMTGDTTPMEGHPIDSMKRKSFKVNGVKAKLRAHNLKVNGTTYTYAGASGDPITDSNTLASSTPEDGGSSNPDQAGDDDTTDTNPVAEVDVNISQDDEAIRPEPHPGSSQK